MPARHSQIHLDCNTLSFIGTVWVRRYDCYYSARAMVHSHKHHQAVHKYTWIPRQYPLLPLSVRCPQMVWGYVCVCLCIVQNALICTEWTDMWICQCCAYFKFIPSTHARTHPQNILTPFEAREMTELKADTADSNTLSFTGTVQVRRYDCYSVRG